MDEEVVDENTGKKITFPYISGRSLRIHLSPSKYEFLGDGEIKFFGSGQSLGEWATKRMKEIVDNLPFRRRG